MDTTTFSTFLSRMSFITLQRGSYLALSSSRFFFSSSSSGSSKPSLVTETRFLPVNKNYMIKIFSLPNIIRWFFLEKLRDKTKTFRKVKNIYRRILWVVGQHIHRWVQSCKRIRIRVSSNAQQMQKQRLPRDFHQWYNRCLFGFPSS